TNELKEVTNHPLAIYVISQGDEAYSRLVYDSGRFDDGDARRLFDAYLDLTARLAAAPETPLGEVSLLAPEERKRLVERAAAPEVDWPRDACVHRLVAEQAQRTPDAAAIAELDGSTLTYRQLMDRSRRLGHHLRSLGVGPDVLVAVSVERSPAMVVALLGVLEAGGAYLPVDPAYPAERIAFMLEDSSAGILLTQDGVLEATPEVPHVVTLPRDGDAFADLPTTPVDLEGADAVGPTDAAGPEHLAYVIYTSGSTGRPKGVLVEHRNLTHYATDAARVYGITAGERVLQFATVSFDTSAEEIYPALLTGATLVLRDDAMLSSPGRFLEVLGEQRIDVLNLPTAYWHELCAAVAQPEDGDTHRIPDQLRLTVIGGEAALAERLEQWHAHLDSRGERSVALWNTYGPTESTIVVTRHELTDWRPAAHGGEVPIGRPIANARAYVVGTDGGLRPPGLPGELWVGGPGVTRGYLGHPDLTAERFVDDPFAGEGRLYRTGDRVAATEDGVLLFRGRVDQQVKIRGFRIEPGEIESALLRHDGVRDAVVVARGDGGDARLVAYLVPADPATPPAVADLRTFLGRDLPDYMVPAAFAVLDALPTTPSGKVDRRALPDPEGTRLGTGVAFVAPRTPIEEILAELWADLLGVDAVGVHEDFFQLGGHSLLVGRLTSRLRKGMGVELPLVAVFENPTVAELAERVQQLA
ncbi:MAG: amino acid adenylation domain-containing protein, partial [Acidobacteriota bacterium]